MIAEEPQEKSPDAELQAAIELQGKIINLNLTGLDRIAFDVMGYDTAVPEPATWAMMIAGFGFAGVALRRRRRTPVSFA